MRLTNKAIMAGLLSTCVLFAGCGDTPEEKAEKDRRRDAVNNANLASPEVVGKLPDGRMVSRVTIQKEGEYYDHYIYFVDNATVSANYSVASGKTRYNAVRVSLPENPTPEQIIATAEKIKQEQMASDEAEFDRLKQKLGR